MTGHTTGLVVRLDEVDPAEATALAGSKMGRLTELHRIGVTVPRGFSATVEAYRRYCAGTGLDSVVDATLAQVTDPADADQAEAASARIRAAFAETPIPEDVGTAILDAYEELCDRCLEVNLPVAVRSSATGEDSDASSFAGIFDTYLGIAGSDRVLDAVRRCWASLFTARALSYRLERAIPHTAMPMAVGVVELIHARASGVAFSVHPVTGKADRIVVEGSFGWGEAIVQGLVTPDHAEVGKSDRRVLRYDVADKAVVSAFDYALGRVAETAMPVRLRTRRVLDDEQLAAVVDAVVAIERHYGHPVDVEWVLGRHRRPGEPVCVVQARPVTVQGASEAGGTVMPVWDPAAAFMKYASRGTR